MANNSLGDIIAHLKLDISQFQEAAEKAASEAEQLAQSLNNVGDNVSGTDKIADSLTDAEAAAKKAKEELDKMNQTGKDLSTVGKSLTTWVSLPIFGAAAASVKLASDFEQGMANVSAISGATGKDLEELSEKAKEMGAKTRFSARDASDALSYMAMAGWKTQDMLDGLEGIMTLAAASGEDLAMTSDIVTDALTAFGLAAKDSGRFADILAAASSNSNTNVAMMGESFKYVAPVAGALGMSAEDTSIALGLMANAGIKSSQAGTSLRGALTRLVKPTKQSAALMKNLGISATNSDGSMKSLHQIMEMLRDKMGGLSEAQQAQAAATIFGQEAMSGMLAIINTSDSEFDKLTEAIYGSEGAAKKMEETMNNTFEGALANMESALEALGIEIGEALIPVLKLGAKAIATLASWLSKIPDPIRNVLVVLALLVAAIGPVVWMFGTFITNAITIIETWGRLSKAFKAGEGVFKLIKPLLTGITTGLKGLVTKVLGSVIPALQSLWGFLLANPITLVIAAIAALVAAFIYCWNNVDGFKEFWIELWENIKSFCKDATEAIVDWVGQFVEDLKVFWTEKVPEAGQKVIDWFQQLPERIGEFLSNAIDKVKNWVVEFAEKALEAGKQFLDNVINFICQLPEQIWYWLVFCVAYVVLWSKQMIEKAIEVGKQFLENIINFFKELPGKVLEFLTNAKNNVVQWSTEMTNKAIETGTNFLNNIVTFFRELPGKILDFITQAKQNVIQWASEMSNKARETGTNFLNNIITFFRELPGKVAQWLNDTIRKVTQWATDMMNKARETGTKFLENVSQFIRQLPGKIAEWLNQVIAKVKQWAIDMGNKAREAGRKVYDNVIQPIKELPGRMVQLGRDIISGIINGITGAAKRLYTKMRNIASEAINAAKEKLGIHSPSRVFADEVGTQIPAGIEQGILSGQRELLNTIDSMSNDLVVGASVDTTKLGSMNIQPNMYANSNSTLMTQLLNELHKLNDKRTEYNINIDKVNADNPNDIRRLAEELEAFKRYKTTF